MRLAEPEGSRAVLVGSAHYADPALDDIPPVVANVEDLAAILVDPDLAGFLPGNVHRLIDPDARAGRAIARWCREATDVLLVYFAGHGLVGDTGELLLALTDTENDLKEQSTLPIAQLRSAIAGSPAEVRVLVLDCCYAGRALGQTMGDDDIMGHIDVGGTYVLASAPRHLTSLFVEGESHTAFSGELVTLLRDGVANHSPLLTLPTVYQQLRLRLGSKNRPPPKVLHTDSASELALVRNRGYVPEEDPVAAAGAQAAGAQPTAPLRTPAEADELVRRLSGDIRSFRHRLSLIADPKTRALDELQSAALDPAWPILARLRFACVLANAAADDRAAAALSALGAAADPDVVDNVRSYLWDLTDDRAWTRHGHLSWDTDGLLPRRRRAEGVDPAGAEELWGTAMAMLLDVAGLPTTVRVRALVELAGLGHRDQAVLIARGMLRDRDADPDLTAAVDDLLLA